MCFSPVIIFAAFCRKFGLVKLFSSFGENDWYMFWHIIIIHILSLNASSSSFQSFTYTLDWLQSSKQVLINDQCAISYILLASRTLMVLF